MVYDAHELAALAREAWAFLAVRQPGAPKIRFESPPAGRRPAEVDLGDRDRQRRHAVPGRFGDGRIDRARPRRAPGRASGAGRDARPADRQACRAPERGARPRAASCAKASSTSMSSASTTQNRRAEIVQALERVLAEVRICVQDWRPMVARVDEVIEELKANPPPVPVGRHRRGDPVPGMADRRQLHAARRARLCADRHRPRPRAGARQRARPAARRRRAGAHAAAARW